MSPMTHSILQGGAHDSHTIHEALSSRSGTAAICAPSTVLRSACAHNWGLEKPPQKEQKHGNGKRNLLQHAALAHAKPKSGKCVKCTRTSLTLELEITFADW
jgi:hypothetical protein